MKKVRQRGLFGLSDQYERLSALGDQLELLSEVVDFEVFRPLLIEGLQRSDRVLGGRPPYDPVVMFKILVIQVLNDLSDERAEYLMNDRLSFMRFLGFEVGDKIPDARTIWLYRDLLTKSGVMDKLFDQFNEMIKEKGYLAMGGQIVDATIVSAPRQRMTKEEKEQIKSGKTSDEIWDNPAKARQKDTQARWVVKYSKAKRNGDGKPPPGHVDIAIPEYGYKNHITIDKAFGFIRHSAVTDAATYDGKVLKHIVTAHNTASGVWADTAYRSKENEAWLKTKGRVSHIHHKKPKGKPMAKHISRGNQTRSKIRAKVEHVFAHQKHHMKLSIRSVGIDRAKTKIILANLTYNMKRLIFHQGRITMG